MQNLPDRPKLINNPVLLDSVLNSIQDISIIILDANGLVLYLNSQAHDLNLLDFPIQIGSSFYEAIPQKHKEIKGLLRNLYITGVSFRTSLERAEAGIKTHYDIRFSPLYNNNQIIAHVLIEIKDVSGEKIFANKMSRVSDDFSQLIENAHAIIIGTDGQGYITDWNDMCEQILGYAKQEVYTKQLIDLLHGENQLVFSEKLQLVMRGIPLSNYELAISTKAGELSILLLNATARRNVSGKIDGILFVGQDITELISYRKTLETKVAERTEKLHALSQEIARQRDAIEEERKRSDEILFNILPPFVTNELKEKGHVAPRHFAQASIMFVDLANFTILSKGLTPDEIVYELNYIFVGFDMILERNGMEKIKTIGDGYMGAGGLPVENKTHASDAVRSALEVVAFVKRIATENQKHSRPPWEVRIGIHTGELIAGVIGRNKFAYDVWGSTVNIASRMESAGASGRVNISSSTYTLVRDEFECVSRGNLQVKNMGTLGMYFVEGKK